MKSILITGANRGIGFGLVKHLIENPGPLKYLFATYRNPEKMKELQSVVCKHENVYLYQLDITNFKDHDLLVQYIDKKTNGYGLNVLINNAGVSSKFTRINLVKSEQMIENFMTNAVAPLMMSKAMLPLLKKASASNASSALGVHRAAIINISSVLGSISKNDQGGFYPYRSSKAALNSITKSLSIDVKNDGILVTSLHPGWVKTDMGGPKADLSVDASVQAIVNTLNSLNEKHNGAFIQYDGTELPW
ncbi:uncharacterized protein GBIM_17542 [Gryllus bimaculatus]|nr:uncharacterized protein GBIM_17542 [Gryllus bimaculatus]